MNHAYRQALINNLTNLIIAARSLGDRKEVADAEREQSQLRESDPATIALDERLSALIRGIEQPVNNTERLMLAQRAYDKKLHSAAAKLWADALEADPKISEDRTIQMRYNAACAAALAGSGQGKDSPTPDEPTKAKLREQARQWLRAELDTWSKLIDTNPSAIVMPLEHWKVDSDLAGIRGDQSINALPENERAPWQAFGPM